jgi:hypothetical protein
MRSRRLRYFRFRRQISIRLKDFLAWANARNREEQRKGAADEGQPRKKNRMDKQKLALCVAARQAPDQSRADDLEGESSSFSFFVAYF